MRKAATTLSTGRIARRLRRVAHPDKTCLIANRSGIFVPNTPDHDVENGNHKNDKRNGGHAGPADSCARQRWIFM